MIPILKEYNSKTNAEIRQAIGSKKINANYYPIIAKRAAADASFESFLISEIGSKENLEEKFFGFIKIAWIPLISIIENAGEDLIKKALIAFNSWPQAEKDNFLSYVKDEKAIVKHFKH